MTGARLTSVWTSKAKATAATAARIATLLFMATSSMKAPQRYAGGASAAVAKVTSAQSLTRSFLSLLCGQNHFCRIRRMLSLARDKGAFDDCASGAMCSSAYFGSALHFGRRFGGHAASTGAVRP